MLERRRAALGKRDKDRKRRRGRHSLGGGETIKETDEWLSICQKKRAGSRREEEEGSLWGGGGGGGGGLGGVGVFCWGWLVGGGGGGRKVKIKSATEGEVQGTLI